MGHGLIKPKLVPQHGHDPAIAGRQVGDCFFYEIIKLSLVDLHDKILLRENCWHMRRIIAVAMRGESQFAQNRSV